MGAMPNTSSIANITSTAIGARMGIKKKNITRAYGLHMANRNSTASITLQGDTIGVLRYPAIMYVINEQIAEKIPIER